VGASNLPFKVRCTTIQPYDDQYLDTLGAQAADEWLALGVSRARSSWLKRDGPLAVRQLAAASQAQR
jgi:hypothetical protein